MKYQVTIRTITPLHIGDGETLIKDYDFYSNIKSGETYILNQDAIYGHEFESQGAKARLEVPAARLLSADKFHSSSPYVRYVIKGATDKNVFTQQIKDVYGAAYIPGSSLKGAIRTALMAYAINKGIYKPQKDNLGSAEEQPSQNWEKEFFGDDPNHDWLRVLLVSDSAPPASDLSPFVLINARVETGDNKGSPVVVEAIDRKINFQTEITIDELALKMADKHPNELDWEKAKFFFVNLIPILKEISKKRIALELAAAKAKGLIKMENHYNQMQRLLAKTSEENTAFIQMGWGTGWTGTTVGPWLEEGLSNEIRQRFELGKPPTAPRNWEPNLKKPFPQSRRLQMMGGAPGKPLGWVMLSFTEMDRPSKAWLEMKSKWSKSYTAAS